MNPTTIFHSPDLDIFAKTSKDTAGLIQVGKALWSWARSLSIPFLRALTSVLVLLIAYPIVYSFLLYLNRRLQKNCKDPILDARNYKKIRSVYTRLKEPAGILKSMKFRPAKDVPWFLRPLYWQIIRSIRIITGYYNTLEAKFERFDKPIAPVRPGMRVITGQELQENSLKSYEYLV